MHHPPLHTPDLAAHGPVHQPGAALAACSWSLEPTGPSDLVAKLEACGVSRVQLALDPIRTGAWYEAETVQALKAAGITAISGMMGTVGEDYSTLDTIRATGGVRVDAHWTANLAAAHGNAALAQRLGLRLVTFHAGFLPHSAADPLRATMLGRIAAIARAFADRGVGIALETGQEDADTLLGVLADLHAAGCDVGVNFDPANMILYGMGQPLEAFPKLAPHTRQIHIKDATKAAISGQWGREEVVGTGEVPWGEFLTMAVARAPDAALVIEREAGAQRVADIIAARGVVTAALSRLASHRAQEQRHG